MHLFQFFCLFFLREEGVWKAHDVCIGLVYYRVVCGVVLFPYGRSQKPQEFLTVKTRAY